MDADCAIKEAFTTGVFDWYFNIFVDGNTEVIYNKNILKNRKININSNCNEIVKRVKLAFIFMRINFK